MNKKKVIITVVVAVLVLVIAVSGGHLIYNNILTKKTTEKYDDLASSYAHVSESGKEIVYTDASGVPVENNPIDFPGLKQKNPDIYSWITIKNTNVNYPVLQSATDDNFYLDHDFEKEHSPAGAIYSQFCNHKDYLDRVTVLYGHNMANRSMFASLHDFENSEFFEQNSEMTIYTPDKRLDYVIVAAYNYDDSHIMNSFDFSRDEIYSDFLETVKNPHSITSNVRQGVSLDINDKIVILSTCLDFGEGRFLVVGKLTGETPLAGG